MNVFLLPSRGRPWNAVRFIAAANATGARQPIALVVDSDDPTVLDYATIKLPPNWRFVRLPAEPRGLGPKLNYVFEMFKREPFYGLLGDDLIPRTEGWDDILVRAAGQWNVAWPNDTIQGPRLCTHHIVGGELIRAAGWIIAPGLMHLYGDNAWFHIGGALGRLRYREDVIMEHMHWSVGKAVYDPTYAQRTYNDKVTFEKWRDAPTTQAWLAELKDIVNAK